MRGPCCAASAVAAIPRASLPLSCRLTATRAFWEYRSFRCSLWSDQRNPAGAPPMRGQPFSRPRHLQRFRSRRIASAVLWASLTALWSIEPAAAIAQATSSSAPPPLGMGTTSPLAAPSAGIPLDSTEIVTPGISPVVPSQSTQAGTCAGSDGAGPSGTFDGGGFSGSSPLSCADSRTISSPLPSASSIGRVGIPPGATEIGGVGISAAAPVPGPGLASVPTPADSPSTNTNSGNP